MPSSHLILCHPLLLLPPIPPSIRVFSNESTLPKRWPKYWNFSFSIIPSKDEEELKSLLMKVKEEGEKVGLKLNIQQTKIIASGPITSWQIDGQTVETVAAFILGGSKIIADGDCSHEITTSAGGGGWGNKGRSAPARPPPASSSPSSGDGPPCSACSGHSPGRASMWALGRASRSRTQIPLLQPASSSPSPGPWPSLHLNLTSPLHLPCLPSKTQVSPTLRL